MNIYFNNIENRFSEHFNQSELNLIKVIKVFSDEKAFLKLIPRNIETFQSRDDVCLYYRDFSSFLKKDTLNEESLSTLNEFKILKIINDGLPEIRDVLLKRDLNIGGDFLDLKICLKTFKYNIYDSENISNVNIVQFLEKINIFNEKINLELINTNSCNSFPDMDDTTSNDDIKSKSNKFKV